MVSGQQEVTNSAQDIAPYWLIIESDPSNHPMHDQAGSTGLGRTQGAHNSDNAASR